MILYNSSRKVIKVMNKTEMASTPWELTIWWADNFQPMCVLSHFTHVQLFATPWTTACQAPLSMGFSRQEYWSGLPCSPPGDLPNPGINPASLLSPALAGRFLPEKPLSTHIHIISPHFLHMTILPGNQNRCYSTSFREETLRQDDIDLKAAQLSGDKLEFWV